MLTNDGCQQVTRTTRGLMRPAKMQIQRCPSPWGWTEHLTQSSDFSAYDAAWEMRQGTSGFEITYRLKTKVSLPVPQMLVEVNVIRGVKQTLTGLKKALKRRND